MNRSWLLLLNGLVLVMLLLAFPIAAVAYRYDEDFYTKQYCDQLLTTADWDTVAGQIQLPPFELELVASLTPPSDVIMAAVVGDHAYLAGFGAGIYIVDISDPESPTLQGTYTDVTRVQWVVPAGDHLYIADSWGGLLILDISDPTDPSLVGVTSLTNASYLELAGNYAYVANYTSGLAIMNITDPTNPLSESSYPCPGNTVGLAVAGDYVFVTCTGGGLQVIDVSTPSAPSLAGSLQPPGEARAIALAGDRAFLGCHAGGVQVVDISDPTTPFITGSLALSLYAGWLDVVGDYLYVSGRSPVGGAGDLLVIDIRDPDNPVLLDSETVPTQINGVTVVGDYAFVGTYSSGLQVIKVSETHDLPLFVGSYDTPGLALDLDIAGDYVYVADNDYFHALNISDPALPVFAGTYAVPGDAGCVVVEGDYAFVTVGGSGLMVFDVSDPLTFSNAWRYDTSGTATGVALAGNLAFVAEMESRIQILDISNPEAPAFVDSLVLPDVARSIVVDGDLAYVACHSAGIVVLDLTVAAAPVVAGTIDTPGSARDIALAGDYAYVADTGGDVQVLDISTPSVPFIAGSLSLPGEVQSITVEGNTAYAACKASGLHVIDVSNPVTPVFVSTYDTPYFALRSAVHGNDVYVADDASGVQILECRQRGMELNANSVQSLAIDDSEQMVISARLSSAQVDSFTWQLSADGGVHWEPAGPGAEWLMFAEPGNSLIWQSTLVYSQIGVNPTCTDLQVEWLYDSPVIDAVEDVPNDQGRQVSLTWTRSGHDYVGSATPIEEYAVYRRIDDDLKASAGGSASTKYPPGDWHYLMAVPADAEQVYAVVVPTLADSTVADGMYYTNFFVRARTATPGVYFDSLPDSGYSLDNLAPEAPANLHFATGRILAWDSSPAADFNYFTVYGSDLDHLDEAAVVIGHTTDINLDVAGHEYNYYHLTATDFAGNEGGASSHGGLSGVAGHGPIPVRYTLHRGVPNPFNPQTTIAYEVAAAGGWVSIAIFDVQGRLVRVLVDEPRLPGYQSVTWSGKDDTGCSVAAGVYFCRMRVSTYEQTRKLLLVQ